MSIIFLFFQVAMADDYSDPFDAKNEQKNKGVITENNGYMEPYEAQRLMTGEANVSNVSCTVHVTLSLSHKRTQPADLPAQVCQLHLCRVDMGTTHFPL